MMRSWNSAMMAATDIFQVRKYNAMMITARMMNAMRARMACCVMSWPQVAPMKVAATFFCGTL